MRYLMVISYDGSKFHGFQRQKNVRNVQGYLENILSKILNEQIIIKGAGRTDAFVHAKYQVAHFDTNKNIKNLKNNLNKELKDIKILKIKKVSNDFHARHSVKNKTYLYKIDLSNTLDDNYYLKINYNLDIKAMKKASVLFLGRHNFQNFTAGKRDDYNTTIRSIKIYKRNNILYLKFNGLAFYRYMVRNLVGALLEVGKGKVDKEYIKNMLDNYDVDIKLPTAKPNGLYLIKVNH